MPKVTIGVYEEEPKSFGIEAFLLKAFSTNPDHILSLIKPGPLGRGREIYHRLENIPIIGLTWQPTPNHAKRAGFPGISEIVGNDHDEGKSGPEFEPEALLILDVSPDSLPSNIPNAWVLQVADRKNQAAYIEVASSLMKEYRINVIVTSATMDNPDTKNDGVEVKLGNEKVFNPVVIRTTKKTT